jgi:hypothetical protein
MVIKGGGAFIIDFTGYGYALIFIDDDGLIVIVISIDIQWWVVFMLAGLPVYEGVYAYREVTRTSTRAILLLG